MKRTNKKMLSAILAALLLAGFCTGCGSTPPASDGADNGAEDTGTAAGSGEIALLPMTLDNEFYVAMKNGAEEKCKELGYTLIAQSGTSHGDAAEQLQLMETMIQKKVKAIMITPCSTTGIISGIKKANEANIPVVILDTEVDREALDKQGAHTLTYIGSDNYNGGKVAGEYAKKVADEKGKTLNVIILTGVPGQENMELRKQGFIDAAGDSVNIVASQNADSDFNKGYDVITNLLTSNKDVDFIYCCNDMMALGALRATKEAGLTIDILGFDGITDAFKSIEEGGLCGSVAQKPADMGIEGVTLADRFLKGETVEEKVNTNLEVADASNVEEWMAYAAKYSGK
ncbi:sugar ABC transporter substrate-binding protein [Butyricicoccus faecihominis]|uniref:sugar ABC transporter substrate-binding protein n=1 Tax=Butyricicoccus faecihominis TaxID=1712515 RepID=UPI002479DE7B|nr:sugar ABC transporter substrate-binding protein [Butyricicoccus faecihominis]MCQ5128633.1 sugar ABC transporter substrate-binding protein [Butyricicoccus faecihominis]